MVDVDQAVADVAIIVSIQFEAEEPGERSKFGVALGGEADIGARKRVPIGAAAISPALTAIDLVRAE
ncbi:hypothetical protein D9M72_650360 [compost metagenome]